MKRLFLFCIALVITAVFFTGCGEGDSDGTNINDTERPDSITDLTVIDVGDGYVTLDWTAVSDNVGVAGYEITAVELSVTRKLGKNTSYTWQGLVNGTTYTFSIVAYDASGNKSATPDTASGTPQEPDTDPPSEVTNPDGTGGWHDPVGKDYVDLNLWWTGSSSTDISYYLLSISDDGGSTYTILADFDIGNVNTLTVPDGVVQSSDLTPNDPFAIGTTYTLRVVAVDLSANQSTGVTFTVTPTESQDTTPPGAVRNLDADPDDQFVVLTWDEPLPVGDAASYHVYYRVPILPFPDNATTWNSFSTTTSLTETVTGLTNGTLYEFMVCAADGSGNEHDGGDSADESDDTPANKITSIPTSDSILCTPNIRGGVFTEDQFLAAGADIVFMVTTSQAGLLTTDANTEVFYTLDGSEIDTTDTSTSTTRGYYDFTSANVTEVTPGYLYYVTIDFDPFAGGVQQISENILRPDGASADHIVLKLLVKTPTDSSKVFRETYLIYPDSEHDFRVFSGMREERSGPTATFVEQGSTAGDVIYIGGNQSTTAERYRLAFEHFENVQAAGAGYNATMAARSDHKATLLTDGSTILVTGGYDSGGTPLDGAGNESLGLDSFERFDADIDTIIPYDGDGFNFAGSMDLVRRFHTATRLYNGQILVTGGLNGETVLYGGLTVSAFTVQNADPSRSTLESLPGEIPISTMSSTDIGSVVEILNGAGTAVVQTGILTNFNWDPGATPPPL
ncbi:fibronectin type III domain-containing protein [Planctomycetota bacterium]